MKLKKMNLRWIKTVVTLIMIVTIYKIMSRLDVYSIACSLLIVVLVLSIFYARHQAKKDMEMLRKPNPKPIQFQYTPRQRKKFNPLKLEQLRSMDEFDFEVYVKNLYQKLGFSNACVTSKTNDEGRDIEMNRDSDSQLYFVEVKRYGEDSIVSRPQIQKLCGSCMVEGAKGIFVTCGGGYSKPALDYAKKANIQCITKEQLLNMIETVEKQEKGQAESTELNTSVSS